MSRDFAGRPIIIDGDVKQKKIEPGMVKVQDDSDFANYDRVRDESPMFLIGYREEFDMSEREKQVRRIR